MKLTLIDPLFISDHIYLEPDDCQHCLFFGEYTAYAGYGYSELNQLIYNFKKPVSRRKSNDWQHKLNAINQVADLFLKSRPNFETNYTWVPIPPSMTEEDEAYDDRLWEVLKILKKEKPNLDIRKLIKAKQSRESAHLSNKRLSVKEHINNWYLDQSCIHLPSPPNSVIIFDDIITTGASFKAAQQLLLSHFPNLKIFGVFIGRRTFKNFA